jgi:hypothetical protein
MNQFGYVKGRYIGENVRCVVDINEICDQKNISALAIQIDFEKAFDSINWNFMFRTLEKINFGQDFIDWVKCFVQKYIISSHKQRKFVKPL